MAVMLKDESLEVKIDKDKSGQKSREVDKICQCLKQMVGQHWRKLA